MPYVYKVTATLEANDTRNKLPSELNVMADTIQDAMNKYRDTVQLQADTDRILLNKIEITDVKRKIWVHVYDK
jgi:hypothetical protein